MGIQEVKEDKKRYLDLLLLADEQEEMIDRYLERGTMYVLGEDEAVKAMAGHCWNLFRSDTKTPITPYRWGQGTAH